MELWFSEKSTENTHLRIKVKKQLFSGESSFQKVDVFESVDYGRVLVIDGILMLTEKDEFIYHEMITHVAMATNPAAKRVLVVGGGDGGTVRELVRYPGLEKIDMVEIDKLVVDTCREYLPQTSHKLDEPRVTVLYEDGIDYVRRQSEAYDIIIVDSTDPFFGPGEGLFTDEFYRDCHKALGKDGILINQHESPYYDIHYKLMARAHRRIRTHFPICKVYQMHIPTYPSGHWLLGFASKSLDPIGDMDAAKWNGLGLYTRYYNTNIHAGAFYLPTYVNELLSKADEIDEG